MADRIRWTRTPGLVLPWGTTPDELDATLGDLALELTSTFAGWHLEVREIVTAPTKRPPRVWSMSGLVSEGAARRAAPALVRFARGAAR